MATVTIVASAEVPRYRLVAPAVSATRPIKLDDQQRSIVDHQRGPLLMVGGPGTGKTTLLVEAAAAKLATGADPESLLLLTLGRKSAAQLREQVVLRLGRTTTEPLVRTFHSYAFSLLRRLAADRGAPPPRLLTSAEQDVLIRELLAGDTAGAGVSWPERLRPILRTRGFAVELRDLLLRAYERGVDPVTLDRWGRKYQRADWRAAARFMQQYADVTELRDAGLTDNRSGGTAYDPAELIQATVAALRKDAALLRDERRARRFVFVDEYADVDPAQEELLELICGGGQFLLAAGDPDQSIYAFRGSDAKAVSRFSEFFRQANGAPATTVVLSTSYRCSQTVLQAANRIAARLRGPARHRDLSAVTSGGRVDVRLLRSPSQEAAYIAHQLRSAHLLEGIDWSSMAVIVRSASRQLASLRRAMRRAGVPVAAAADEVPLLEQPAVAPFLLLLRCALRPDTLDEEAAVALLTSCLGGADSLSLRRLRHFLRQLAGVPESSGELLVAALQDPAELKGVAEPWAEPAQAVARLLEVARTTNARGASPEHVLWDVWEASGLGDRWQRGSASGGSAGEAADRDLDAIIALLDAAAQFSDRMPGAGALVFVESLRGQRIPRSSLAPAAAMNEAVRIVTAHAAKGLTWDFVVVAGVHEGAWPDLRIRGSILGSEDLVDLAAGRPIDRTGWVSRVLDEERRLFYVAVSRARRRLLVTAAAGADQDPPSRFLDELDPLPPGVNAREYATVPRALSLPGLVAELRQVVVDVSDPRRLAAADQLARLALAGVAGADPSQWWGVGELSDARPLYEPGQRVAISPSSVEKFSRCPLRWFLESNGGAQAASASQGLGLVIHDIAAWAGSRASVSALSARLETHLTELDLGSGWFAERTRDRARSMVAKLAAWFAANRRRFLAAEREFSVPIGDRSVLRGRVDRLEADENGRVVVIDFKTGKQAPAKADIAQHPQLGLYQLAVMAGAFADLSTECGGAALVHLGTSTKKVGEQSQPSLAEAEDPAWAADMVNHVCVGMAAEAFAATENAACTMCPVRAACPLHAPQVTNES